MANTPFNVFSQHCDPDEVLEALKELLPDITIKTNDSGMWTSAKGTWKRGWLKSALTMTVNHDPSYYTGEGWATQLSGMAGYFGNFPDADRRPDLFGYIPGLCFAVSFILEPGSVENDPRQAVVFQITDLVDGVIFLPGCLLDSQARVIVAADGASEPEAQLPEHEPAELSTAGSGEHDAQMVLDPPSVETVVARFLFMCALANRGYIEKEPELREALLSFLPQPPPLEQGEPDEVAALEAPVGSLSEKMAWKLPWLAEGAAVLAWSLELMDLPSYDEMVDAKPLFEIARQIADGTATPSLRSRSDLEELAFQMLAIHWRLRQFFVKQTAMNFEEYAPNAWCGAMDLSLATLIDHDLAVNGRPLCEAPEETWKCSAGIMEERRNALHWVLGHHPVYSKNDTST